MSERDVAFLLGGAVAGLIASVILDRALSQYLPGTNEEQCMGCLSELSACETALQYETRMSQELLSLLGRRAAISSATPFKIEGFASSRG